MSSRKKSKISYDFCAKWRVRAYPKSNICFPFLPSLYLSPLTLRRDAYFLWNKKVLCELCFGPWAGLARAEQFKLISPRPSPESNSSQPNSRFWAEKLNPLWAGFTLAGTRLGKQNWESEIQKSEIQKSKSGKAKVGKQNWESKNGRKTNPKAQSHNGSPPVCFIIFLNQSFPYQSIF